MPFRRNATVSLNRRLTSIVLRFWLALPPDNRDIGHVLQVRRLRHQIHRATRRAATGGDRRGALGDFDRLGIEGVAADDARVARAVDVNVVAGAEAADQDVVARRGATFAGGQRDARRVAERVSKRRGRLILQHRLRDDDQRLRCVAQWLCVFRRGDHRVRRTAGHLDRFRGRGQFENGRCR